MTEAQRLAERIETENYEAASMIRRLEAECEALRKDAERLNWLEQGGQWELTRLRASAKPDAMRYWMVEDFDGDDLTQDTDEAERQTLRGAIDAAMGKEKA
jgi:hypothetical protein